MWHPLIWDIFSQNCTFIQYLVIGKLYCIMSFWLSVLNWNNKVPLDTVKTLRIAGGKSELCHSQRYSHKLCCVLIMFRLLPELCLMQVSVLTDIKMTVIISNVICKKSLIKGETILPMWNVVCAKSALVVHVNLWYYRGNTLWHTLKYGRPIKLYWGWLTNQSRLSFSEAWLKVNKMNINQVPSDTSLVMYSILCCNRILNGQGFVVVLHLLKQMVLIYAHSVCCNTTEIMIIMFIFIPNQRWSDSDCLFK